MTEAEKQKLLENTGVLEFKDRLSLALEGMSGNAFAKKIGMSEAVIRDYLAGKTYPSLNRLALIAIKCDIPIEWLAVGQGKCRLSQSECIQNIVYIPDYQTKLFNQIEKSNSNMLPFNLNFIKNHNVNVGNLYSYHTKGDSMSPTISDGDTLILDTANTIPFDGYIYLIEYGKAMSIKRIQNHGKYFLLLSDNKTYPSIKIDKLNADISTDFKIIGKIICFLKDLS